MFDTPSLRSRIKLIAAGLVFGLVIGFLPEPIGTLGFWDERDRLLLEKVAPGLPGVLIGGFMATLTVPMIIRWYLRFIEREKWLESSAVIHTVSDLYLFIACVSAPCLLIQLSWQHVEAAWTWGDPLVYAVSLYLGMKSSTIRLIQSIGRGVPNNFRTAVVVLLLMVICACAIATVYLIAVGANRWMGVAPLNLVSVTFGLIWLLVAAWLCEEKQAMGEDQSAAEESSS